MTLSRKGSPQREKVILIVEDDSQNLKLFRDLLRDSGYKTLEATDGKQAVELAKNKKPNLILMDIRMPVMDGLEAASILKNNDKTKNIPIIALTALAMNGDEERILRAGYDGYISKPFHIKELLKQASEYTSNGHN